MGGGENIEYNGETSTTTIINIVIYGFVPEIYHIIDIKLKVSKFIFSSTLYALLYNSRVMKQRRGGYQKTRTYRAGSRLNQTV